MSGSFNLKHAADGNLMHGPHGHLADGCGGGAACPCAAATRCGNCPDVTPTQFHVTFTGVTICADCVSCGSGLSFQMTEGSTLEGTFVLTQNGDCAWTAFASDVGCSGKFYFSDDCSGEATEITFAVQQVRTGPTQFEIQVTDESNEVLLFSATLDAGACCAGYSVLNGLMMCGCAGDGDSLIVALGSGGTATVTPC
ncbi:MAG TPA: hypothetical protein VG326_08565 [Tepidisphaeraceae bacterium]|jgi:hypothetical protein|nr:hypothetical protein [Tepidisphaeraceae bacterium]